MHMPCGAMMGCHFSTHGWPDPLDWHSAQQHARVHGHRLVDAGRTASGARMLRCSRCGATPTAKTLDKVMLTVKMRWNCVPEGAGEPW